DDAPSPANAALHGAHRARPPRWAQRVHRGEDFTWNFGQILHLIGNFRLHRRHLQRHRVALPGDHHRTVYGHHARRWVLYYQWATLSARRPRHQGRRDLGLLYRRDRRPRRLAAERRDADLVRALGALTATAALSSRRR